jgi:hypothetical protein
MCLCGHGARCRGCCGGTSGGDSFRINPCFLRWGRRGGEWFLFFPGGVLLVSLVGRFSIDLFMSCHNFQIMPHHIQPSPHTVECLGRCIHVLVATSPRCRLEQPPRLPSWEGCWHMWPRARQNCARSRRFAPGPRGGLGLSPVVPIFGRSYTSYVYKRTAVASFTSEHSETPVMRTSLTWNEVHGVAAGLR